MKEDKLPSWQDFQIGPMITSSFFGGLGQKMVTAPLSLLKRRLQNTGMSVREVWKVMKQKEGQGSTLKTILSFWKSNGLSILKSGTYNCLNQTLYIYAINHPYRSQLAKDWHSIRISQRTAHHLSLGLFSWGSATLATTITYPMELIVSRYANQIKAYQFKDSLRILDDIYQTTRNSGMKTWFRGYTSTLISSSPFNSSMGVLFYKLNQEYGYHTTVAGGLAAGLSSLITHPLNTIAERAKNMKLDKPMGFFDMIRYLNKTQGYINSQLTTPYHFHPTTGVLCFITDTPHNIPLEQALLPKVKREFRTVRLWKTYWAGLLPNLLKSCGTYSVRWTMTMFFYQAATSKK